MLDEMTVDEAESVTNKLLVSSLAFCYYVTTC
jgi:hypothetical protein